VTRPPLTSIRPVVDSRKRLPNAARRETILLAATTTFAKAGYRQARVIDIAKQVGVTEPIIFRIFGTKAELFAAVVNRASRDLAAELDAMTKGHTNVYQLLRGLLSAEHLDLLHRGGGLGVLLIDSRSVAADKDVIARASRKALARSVKALEGLLARGQMEGSIREDSDDGTLAWLLLSLIHAREFGRTRAGGAFADVDSELLATMLDVVRSRRPDN